MNTEKIPNDVLLNIEKFLTDLAQTKSTAQFILNDYRNEKWLLETGLIDQTQFDYYVHGLTKRMINLRNETEDIDEKNPTPKVVVFLSYNRADLETALKIQKELSRHGVSVRMDVSDVLAGESIEEFIINQTKESAAVLLLLSKDSFSSAWVSYESTIAIFNQILNKKLVIPLGTFDFTDDAFSTDAHKTLKRKHDEIVDRIHSHELEGFGTGHLDKRKRQLHNALHRLSDILLILSEKAVYSINGKEFDLSIKRIAGQLLATAKS